MRRKAPVADRLLDHAVEAHDLLARSFRSRSRLDGLGRRRGRLGRRLDDVERRDRRQKLVELVQGDVIFVRLELPLDILAHL